MRITPLDIRKQEFRKTMRGLDSDEVYAFLSTVADEYEAVLSDNKRLRERIVEHEERLQEYRGMEQNLRNTLMTAERVTSEAKENARREAGLIVREAEIEAEKAAATIRAHTQQLRSEVLELKKQKDNYLARMKTLIESHRKVLDGFEEDFAHADEEIERIGEQVVEDTERTVTPPRMSREKITEPFEHEASDKVTWGDERKREDEPRPAVPPPGWEGAPADRDDTPRNETMQTETTGRDHMTETPAGLDERAETPKEEAPGLPMNEQEARRIVQHGMEERMTPATEPTGQASGPQAPAQASGPQAPVESAPGVAPLAGMAGRNEQPAMQAPATGAAGMPPAAGAPGMPERRMPAADTRPATQDLPATAADSGPAPEARPATATETQPAPLKPDTWKQYEVRDEGPDWKSYEIQQTGQAQQSAEQDCEVEEALSSLTEDIGMAGATREDTSSEETPAPKPAPDAGAAESESDDPKEDAGSTWSMEELRKNLSSFGRDD